MPGNDASSTIRCRGTKTPSAVFEIWMWDRIREKKYSRKTWRIENILEREKDGRSDDSRGQLSSVYSDFPYRRAPKPLHWNNSAELSLTNHKDSYCASACMCGCVCEWLTECRPGFTFCKSFRQDLCSVSCALHIFLQEKSIHWTGYKITWKEICVSRCFLQCFQSFFEMDDSYQPGL